MSKEEQSLCLGKSTPNFWCGESWAINCPGGPNQHKFTHRECQRISDTSNTNFYCLNRGDKPDLFKQLIYKNALGKTQAVNLNSVLNYDQNGIRCTKTLNIPWNNPWKLHARLGNVNHCVLKNNEKIDRQTLSRLLIRDLGFQGRKWFPEWFWT